MYLQEYLIPFTVSNVVGAAFIFVCFKWPRVAKYIWGVCFIAAGLFNIYTGWTSPQIYVEMYGKTALLSVYQNFISGIFSDKTQLFISLIASGQIAVGVLLFFKRIPFLVGIIGGIAFLVCISPLGVGSGFPATVLMAVSLFLLHRRITKLGKNY
jgi:hypothetical protein